MQSLNFGFLDSFGSQVSPPVAMSPESSASISSMLGRLPWNSGGKISGSWFFQSALAMD